MPTPVHTPEDVSCRVVGGSLTQLRRRGRALEPFIRGLNRPLDELLNPAGAISWDEYLVFVRNSSTELTPDEFIELSTAYSGSPYLRPLLLAAGLWANPARYYEWLADPRDGALKHLFPCLNTQLARAEDRALLITVAPRPGYTRPPDQFWDGMGLAFGALPTHFGLAAAGVEYVPSPEGATFRVCLPRRRPIRFALAWLGSWFRPSTPEDAQAVLALGHERARRHRAEAALHDARRQFRRITDAVPGVVYQYVRAADGSDRFTYVSAGIRDLVGVEPDAAEADPRAMWGSVHPDDLPALLESISASQQAHGPWAAEFRVRDGGGTVKWVRGRATPDTPGGAGDVVWNGILTDVTAEKRGEEVTRAQAARLEGLTANAHVHIVELDRDGIIRYVTRTSAGRTPADVLGRRFSDFMTAPDRDRIAAAIANVFETRRTLTTTQFTAPDGTGAVRVYSATLSPVRTAAGVERVVLTAFDVTGRRRAEDALRESEERLRQAARLAGFGVFDHDHRTGTLYWSPRMREIHDWPVDREPDLDRAAHQVHPDDRAALFDAVGRAHDPAGDGLFACEYRIVLPDGRVRWLRGSAQTAFIGTGPDRRPERTIGAELDVTAAREAAEALRASEERFRGAFDHAPIGMALVSTEGRWLKVNQALCRMFGYTTDELLVTDFQTLTHPDDLGADMALVGRVLAGELATYQMEKRYFHKTGHVVHGRLAVSLIRSPQGAPLYFVSQIEDVTEQKRAADALRASEHKLRAIVDSEPECVKLLDREGRLLEMNPAGLRMIEADSLDAVRGAVVGCIVEPPDRAAFDALTADVFRGAARKLRFAIRGLAGTRRVMETHAVPLWDTDRREVESLLAVTRDITDYTRAEEALRTSERRLALAISATSDAVWERNYRTGEAYYSPRWYEMLDRDPALPMTLETWKELCHPDDFGPAHARIRAALDAHGTSGYAAEFRMRRGDGSWVWILSRGAVVERDAAGAPLLLAGTNTDVTDRKRAEAERDELLARLQLHIERLPLAYVLYDAELRYAGWNPAAEATFGYTREEIIGRPLLDLVPQDTHAAVNAVRDRLLAGDMASRSVNRNVTKSGATIVCEWNNTPLRGPDGALVGILSMAQDVTDQVRTQEALRLKEQSLRLALDAGRMGTWDWELGSDALLWDEHEQALFALPPGTFDSRLETFLRLVHPDDRPGMERALADAQVGQDFDGEFRIVWPNGEVRWIHGTGSVVPAADGRPARLVGVSYDITARKSADDRLLASLREKEAMLKEIHHRVKNNLQVVSSLLSLQSARVTHPAAAAVLAESQNRVRAMALVHETLYRSDDLARVDPARYFGELCAYLFRVYGVDASRVRFELDVDPVPLPLDKTVPCGLIVNEVVSNALKYAFPDGRGGTVRVALRAPGGRFELALSDDGVGLPPDFSIDRTQSLGLQLVAILTEQLCGHLSIDRTGGTAFLISFA